MQTTFQHTEPASNRQDINLPYAPVIRVIRPALLLALILLAACAMLAVPKPAEAASGYAQLPDDTSVHKVGSLYFQRKKDTLYYGSSESKINTKAYDVTWNAYTNGELLYYIKESKGHYYLKLYELDNGHYYRVANMPYAKRSLGVTDYYRISAIYKGYVYLTRINEDDFCMDTYAYKIGDDEDAVEKIAANVDITSRSGKYVLANNDYVTDVSPYRITLYQIASSGKLKKIKLLSKTAHNARFVGKYAYYADYTTPYMTQCCIRRVKQNGSGKKTLATLSSKKGSDNIIVAYDIGATSCKVSREGAEYLYQYKSKKYTKI